ncbi:hypothetical protein BKA01_004978 [Pseudonocardia eucalypti]|uniref:hypothetical protein n=1 Tax=Pseudonocardia eucalypti TaxID=648755 RepID=UPI00161DC5F2|nr:hypothetical protein [Pseudonocardia eucalypti]
MSFSAARRATRRKTSGSDCTTFCIDGTPWVGPWVIGFHRTPTGHYLQLRKAATITVCPMSDSLLAQLVDQLIAEVPRNGA